MTTIDTVLTHDQPFGPIATERLLDVDGPAADRLFDRKNLVYAHAHGRNRPTYIVGRKGAGKTAFLLGAPDNTRQERLRTSKVYSSLMGFVHEYRSRRGVTLYTDEIADVWHALLDHIALLHGCRTATTRDPAEELETIWLYLDRRQRVDHETTVVCEQFLKELGRRSGDTSIDGLHEMIDGMRRGGVTFGDARRAARAVLATRDHGLSIVMDNLEELHKRLDEVQPALAGLFGFVGQNIGPDRNDLGYRLQICLPSEIFADIHDISANPEKDFHRNHFTICWTASELLHLAGSRLRLYLETHQTYRLDRICADRPDARKDDAYLLRSVLPASVTGGLGVPEDPVAYILRHTQLLPRHLIGILNQIFTHCESTPWQATPDAVREGVRNAEKEILAGVLGAHLRAYPYADKVLGRLAGQVPPCFPTKQLHKVFNRRGLAKLTGLEFGEFLTMLLDLGIVGVKTRQTDRYNIAEFQYTFNSTMIAEEDKDELCFHPIVVRHLYERSLTQLRDANILPTYPYGCELDADYRRAFGYTGAG